MVFCYSCGKAIEGQDSIGRQDICPHCRNDLHCCMNCRLFDESVQNECREPQADGVTDSEKNNFCEYFIMREGTGPGGKFHQQQEARAKLEALFKKKTS